MFLLYVKTIYPLYSQLVLKEQFTKGIAEEGIFNGQ